MKQWIFIKIYIFRFNNTDAVSMTTKNIDEIKDVTKKDDVNAELTDNNNQVHTAPALEETATLLPKFTSESCSDLFEDDSVDERNIDDDKKMGKEK